MSFVPPRRVHWPVRLLTVGLVGLLLGASTPLALAAGAVNTMTGNYAYEYTDIKLQDDRFFKLTRSYNSLDTRTGPLGPAWTHSFNVRLEPDSYYGPNSWAFIGPNARTERYQQRADGRFHLAGIQGGVLVRHEEGPFAGTWELAEPDGTLYAFQEDGRPTRITYPDKSAVHLTFDERGRLQFVARSVGERTLTFAYDEGDRLTSVSDWLNPPRQIRFGYDEQGRLATVTDRLGSVTQYRYDGNSQRLWEIEDARGHIALRQEYDPDQRVIRQWNARGVTTGTLTSFTYDPNASNSSYPFERFATTMSYPPSGYAPDDPSVVVHAYDGQRRLSRRETRPAPGDEAMIEEFRYDASWNRTVQPVLGGRTQSDLKPESGAQCVTSADVPGVDRTVQVGRVLQRSPATPPATVTLPFEGQRADGRAPRDPTYDDAGRMTGLTLASREGQIAETWAFTLDDEDRVLEMTVRIANAAPRTWALQYDDVGNVVEQQAPDGAVTRYEYDERDSLIAAHRSNGGVARYEYDERGYLSKSITITAGGGQAHIVEYQHDGLGRLRRVIDHGDSASGDSGQTLELTYQQMTLAAICQR